MNRLLITGAAGFIGRNLVEHFASQGKEVFRDATEGAPGARVDLNPERLAAIMKGQAPDAIIHAAGSGTVARVALDPAGEVSANAKSLMGLLEFARSAAPAARVVLLSSAALYGSAPPAPQGEDDARDPVSLYGVVKSQAEQLLKFYAQQYGIHGTAVRLFSVYGPGLRKQLLWDAMTKFAQGRPEFFGTGEERRDWVHIADVCRFMAALLAQPPREPFEVFNCAAGVSASTAEVLSHLAAVANAGPPRFNGQVRAGDPRCLAADCGKAERLLGWRAQVAWRDGVAEYGRWFADQQDGAGT